VGELLGVDLEVVQVAQVAVGPDDLHALVDRRLRLARL
jgi:hypothetical protein